MGVGRQKNLEPKNEGMANNVNILEGRTGPEKRLLDFSY